MSIDLLQTSIDTFGGHRTSLDGDPMLADLRDHFDEMLATLEAVAGWSTDRVQRPVLILGQLEGVLTGIRRLRWRRCRCRYRGSGSPPSPASTSRSTSTPLARRMTRAFERRSNRQEWNAVPAARARSSPLRTLPVALVGSASTSSTRRGTL